MLISLFFFVVGQNHPESSFTLRHHWNHDGCHYYSDILLSQEEGLVTPSGADLSRIATQGHLFSQIIRKFVVKVEVGYFLLF